MKRKNENFWESIGNPKTALAPMVSYCDLPFRILCNKYGVDLCYTQMYSSSQFAESESIRQIVLKEIGPKLNFPCFIQLNGHDPEKFLTAAKYLENKTPCIDINLGCPQDIAKRGYYGAFLLDHPEEVYKIIGYLCNNNLKCGISCKIRLFDDLTKTY
ncbi:MAG: tRNA-dihydrouridine synthase family protein, partial [archaeon]|nr:tRNA-dihydrouridine synthase family protein [archaeon]